jgi:uncharacterized repeat protein (TIGR01451 family)
MARAMPSSAVRWFRWTLAATLAVTLGRTSPAQSPPTLETGLLEAIKVKIAWLADRDTFACILGAHPTEAGLEICGRVPNEAVHQRALGLARNHSALRIIDRLEVTEDMIRRQPSPTSVEALQREAIALLRQAFGDQARMYHVLGSSNGTVTITGIARSFEEKLRVSQELRLLNPCACVVNQLIVASVERDGRAYEPVRSEPRPGAPSLRPSDLADVSPLAINKGVAVNEVSAQRARNYPAPAAAPTPAARPTVPEIKDSLSFSLPPSIPVPAPAEKAACKVAVPPCPPDEGPELPAAVKKQAVPLPAPPALVFKEQGETAGTRRDDVKAVTFTTAGPTIETTANQPRASEPAALPASVTAPAAALPQTPARSDVKPDAKRTDFASDNAEIDGWSAWAVGLAISTVVIVLFVPVSLRWLLRDYKAKNKPASRKEEAEPREPAPVFTRTAVPKMEKEPEPRWEKEPSFVRMPSPPLPSLSAATMAPASPHGSNTSSSEPMVSLRWVGPHAARLGQTAACQLIVRNTSPRPVYQVVVRHEPAAGVIVQSTEPPAVPEGTCLTWPLESLQPGQERCIDMQIVPETRGDLQCDAQVTFAGSCCLRMQVREPKLALQVTVPDKVMVGQTTTLLVVVTNSGDGIAENVKVTARLPQGLEHAGGQNVALDLGNLMAQESRTLQFLCGARTGGLQRCEITASADGTEPARDLAVLDVLLPQLTIEVTGPKRRYIDRHASYTIRVTNPGSAPASNVTVTHQIPHGFTFHAASAGGRHDEAVGAVSWFIGDVPPGQTGEVSVELVAAAAGTCTHRIKAQAVGGLVVQTEASTLVEGLSSLQIDIVNLDDPVEIGADTAYEIRVINAGSKTETNLELACTLALGMDFRGATGPTGAGHQRQGSQIVFESLRELAPREEKVYRVQVVGREAGDLRFRAQLTARGLAEPVVREKTTKVYGDELAVL